MPRPTPEFQDLVFHAMSPAWMTAKQIYKAMDVGSFAAVKMALNELVNAKRVRKWGPIDEPIFQRANMPADKRTITLIEKYQRDLAEWKGR